MSWDEAQLDAASAVDEATVLELIQRVRQRGPIASRRHPRQHQRRKWRAELEAEIDESCVGGVRSRRVRVQATNLSPNGLAFTLPSYVYVGARVLIELPLPGDPRIEGVIRHCTHLSGRKYRAGMQFVRVIPSE